MIEFTQTVDIEASTEAVFDYVADPHNHPKFFPSTTDISNVEENDIGKQGEYTFKMVGTSTTGRFVDREFDRPTKRVYDLEGDLEGTLSWTIQESNGGVHVRLEGSIDPPGPELISSITDPIADRYLHQEGEAALENLKIQVEERDA